MRLQGSDREYDLVQWANDWISAEPRDDPPPSGLKIANPRRAYLEPDESARLRADYEEYEKNPDGATHHAGFFWVWWKLSDDGERLVPAQKRARR